MPKTYSDLFEQIASFETLCEAWEMARRGKRYRSETMRFGRDLEPNLIELQESLLHKTYRTGPYRHFNVYEPKKREVAALPMKDRVVHHALMKVIEPIFEARFIHDSYACRVGKGTHSGATRAQQFLRKVKREGGAVCAFKADVSKYFPSICHDVLKRLLRRHIACPDTLWLLDQIIDSTADGEELMPRGVPIGNLTSQLFANIYLHELDAFVKYELREPYYMRYMDDFVVVASDKARLHEVRRDVEDFLWANLGLRLNGKTQVFPVSGDRGRPLDFLGYRILPTHRKLRRDSVKRMRRKLKRYARLYREGKMPWHRINASVMSWLGHAKHADTYTLRKRLLTSIDFRGPDGRRPAGIERWFEEG